MGLCYESLVRFKADPADRRHGTISGYRYGCRCDRCRKAGSDYAKDERKRRKEREQANERKVRELEKAALRRSKASRTADNRGRRYAVDICTIPAFLRPLMDRPDIDNDDRLCAICGRPATNMHHIVRRSSGKWIVDGEEMRKPLVRLCGGGNANGCHGLAHDNRLHFRWNDGRWEFQIFPEPIGQADALRAEGGWIDVERWQALRG